MNKLINLQIQQAILFESQGKPNESLKILEKILAEDPNHPDALNLSGVIFIKLHHYEKGIKLIKRAIKKAPKIGTFHFNLANAYVMQNELEKARKEFTNAIKLDNTKEEYYRNLGITLIQLHFYRAAEYNFRQAIKINPSNLDNKLNLASSLLHQFHSKQALKMMKDIEKSATKEQNIPYFFYKNLALAFLTMGQSDLAEKNYLRAISRDEKDLELWVGLALAYANQMKIVEAESAYEKAIEFGADYFENKIAIANALMEAGEYQRSKIVINEVINKRPDYESALISAAKIDGRFGDFDLQENKLRKVLSLNKNSIDAYAQLTQVPGREIKEEEIRIIEKEVNNKSIEGQSKITLAFSLGDIYRQKKNYEKSYNYYKMGNDLKPFVFDQEKYKEYIDKIIETYNKEFFVEMSQFGSESVLPVLIVGTPRSGTTLTEQILSTHAKVFGAGERGTVIGLANTEKQKLPRLDLSPQAIHEVANEKIIEFAKNYEHIMREHTKNDERIVTNKLPGNFLWLGLFATLFPKAKVIHTRRDPRDSLLSIYFKDFAGEHDYAYNLEDLGFWYCEYERLMKHWENVLPNPMMTVQYEEMVEDQESMSRKMIDFLGLDWDDSLLEYYNTKREVKTASIWQVRQPIYTTSVQRWRPYEKHLKPLFNELKKCCDLKY